ncbi:MAG TPA: DUF523 domain-containing protein [Syntrophomonadaceae bacterium]|nr:DUF523 domain-containing protein [Syntrophomonadaceae bacterium]HPR93520.1 DUF523 domain-containing protein [Syntrophomonadaceae bacterium]
MKIISACLCGVNCKYNGSNNYIPHLKELAEKEEWLLLCPETIGGLPVPRLAYEIRGGTGIDVIAGYARVVDANGRDLTEFFLNGAYKVLVMAKNAGVDCAVLKSRSPSCGAGRIYDGSFKSILTDGDGVTAALLKLHNINVVNEEDYFKE